MRKQFFLFKEEEIDLQEPNENFESTKTHLTGCKASEKFLEERITRIQTVPIKQHTPKLKKNNNIALYFSSHSATGKMRRFQLAKEEWKQRMSTLRPKQVRGSFRQSEPRSFAKNEIASEKIIEERVVSFNN